MNTHKLGPVERLVCNECYAPCQANTDQDDDDGPLALCLNRFTVWYKLMIPCHKLSFITVILCLSYKMLKAPTLINFVSIYFFLRDLFWLLELFCPYISYFILAELLFICFPDAE